MFQWLAKDGQLCKDQSPGVLTHGMKIYPEVCHYLTPRTSRVAKVAHTSLQKN